MIDIESLVIDSIKKRFVAESVSVEISSVYEPTPSSFPFVSIVEEDNYTYERTQDVDEREHHATVMYEVNVYSNKKTGKKQEAKKVFAIVDDALQGFKFTRQTKLNDTNADRSIYRITARYEAIVAEPQLIGGNTIYQMYRQ